jgi:hypothetical protein
LAQFLIDSDFQSSALREIAVTYAEAGQPQEVDGILRQAIAAANRITKPNRQSSTLSDITLAYAEAEHPQRADDVFRQALAVANRIDPNTRPGILRDIAVVYAEVGKDPRVALDKIQDPAKKLWATIDSIPRYM